MYYKTTINEYKDYEINISELNFNNNKMDLSCDYGSYTAEKTNNELKIYYNTYEYVNDVEKDIKQEIYSNKKENIVGTDICSREINKELFTEDLFNFLKSEENKSGLIKLDYDNYDSLLQNSNEIKEKECEELNEER